MCSNAFSIVTSYPLRYRARHGHLRLPAERQLLHPWPSWGQCGQCFHGSAAWPPLHIVRHLAAAGDGASRPAPRNWPMFLTHALSTFLKTVKNSSVIIHKIPRIYASQWNKKNPCGRGSDYEIAKCTPELANIVVTTFWTNQETWKRQRNRRKKSMSRRKQAAPK